RLDHRARRRRDAAPGAPGGARAVARCGAGAGPGAGAAAPRSRGRPGGGGGAPRPRPGGGAPGGEAPAAPAPGTMDRFELAVRAVLGQQVSVAGANTIAGRLVRLVGEPIRQVEGAVPVALTHLPVAPGRLAVARPAAVAGIGIPRARAACLVS